MSLKFTIWSKPNCPYCTRAKLIFANKGFSYQEYTVSDGPLEHGVIRGTREELLERAPNARTFPQIWVTDDEGIEKHIGGHDDFVKWLASL